MTEANYQVVRDFFAGIEAGDVPDTVLSPELTVWTTSSGSGSDRAQYQGGIKMLKTIFSDGPQYTIDSLTAQDDRVAAEVRGEGTLVNGEQYFSVYVFIFRVRDGQIVSIAEHFNPDVMREKIFPLFEAMTKQQQ